METELDERLKELEESLSLLDRIRYKIANPLIEKIITDSIETETNLKKEKESLNKELLNTKNKLSRLKSELSSLKSGVEQELRPRILDLEGELENERTLRKTEQRLRKTQLGVLGSVAIYISLTGKDPTNMEALFTYHDLIRRILGDISWNDFLQCSEDLIKSGIIQTQMIGGFKTYLFPFPLPYNKVERIVQAYVGARIKELENEVKQLQVDKKNAYSRGVNHASQRFQEETARLRTELLDYKRKFKRRYH